MKMALQAADWNGFAARRRRAKTKGKCAASGSLYFLEPSGGMGKEKVEIRVESGGRWLCIRTPVRQDKATKPFSPALVADVLGYPRTGSSCVTTMRLRRARRHRLVRLAILDQSWPRPLGRGERNPSRRAASSPGEFEVAPADVVFDTGVTPSPAPT